MDMGLPFDDLVKTWCWKLIRKMPDVECYTSADNAKIKLVKGTLYVCVLLTVIITEEFMTQKERKPMRIRWTGRGKNWWVWEKSSGL